MLDATSTEVRALLRYCEKVSSPVAYKASCLIASGDWDRLVKMKVEPSGYTSAARYLEDLQVVAFLKKHPALPLSVDRKKAAIDSFFKAETLCYWTNERLNPLLDDSFHYGNRMAEFVRLWRKEVRRVLRRAPDVSQLRGRFGPGSTYNNIGDYITVADKLDTDYTATQPALDLVSRSFEETAWSRYAAAGLAPFARCLPQVLTPGKTPKLNPEGYAIRGPEIVDSNRFTTVPKTALTDRGICIEPGLNVFYQLGVGEEISRRMYYAYAWDKTTCQDKHRWLARVGSITGAVATIDLSMASDTVATNLVKLVLPRDWFDLLDQLRCKKTIVNDRKIVNEKFSSMGNGFTFELETLIFSTLCRVIARERADIIDWFAPGCDVSVFGDDIIVPTAIADEVVSALSFFGFVTNADKTFLSGAFRESCGGDYYRGLDVRPHFQKKEVNEPADIIALHNGLCRVRDRLTDGRSDGMYLSPSIGFLRNQLPRKIRSCLGPSDLGDLVLREDNQQRWNFVVRSSKRYFRVWRPVRFRPKDLEQHYRPGVVAAFALWFAGSDQS